MVFRTKIGMVLVLAVMLLAAVASAQTSLGPIKVTTTDEIGSSTPPALPPSGICRHYFNSTTGQETWLNNSGGNCGPTGASGGGINGTLTQNHLSKPSSTGLNPNLVDSNVVESGSPLNVQVPRLEQTRYADNFIWSQSPSGTLNAGIQATVTLTPVPYGIETTLTGSNVENTTLGPYYYVDIAGTGTAETVEVTSTTCTNAAAGTGSCTITFTPAFSHSAGFTVGTANAGTQEAINDCEGTLTNARFCHIIVPCPVVAKTPINWDAPVITHGNNVWLDGQHCARVQLTHRQQGVIMGDHNIGTNTWLNGKVSGFTFTPDYVGTAPQINLVSSITNSAVGIGSASESGFVATYNTVGASGSAAVCSFTTGQLVQISGTGYASGYDNAGAGVTVNAPGCNGGTSFQATLLTSGLSPISTFGSALVGTCAWTVNFTAAHDFKYKDWFYLGGNLNDNVPAGIRQVTDNPASGSSVHFTTSSCSAIQGQVYAGGFAIVEYSVLEDNLNIEGDVSDIRVGAWLSGPPNLFHYGFVVTADQNAVFDNIYLESGNAFRSPTTEWTGAGILGPGYSGVLNSNALGILKLNNSYLSAGNINEIDWQSGNDIEVTNTILQNGAQFGARVSDRRGTFGTAQLHGVHVEMACSNPSGNIGCAGIMSAGMPLDFDGAWQTITYPIFAQVGNQGVQWFYYIQPVSSTSDTLCTTTQPNDQRCLAAPLGNWGTGPMLPAGNALVDSSTFGSPQIFWPPVRGATSYNVFRVTVPAGSTGQFLTMPYGTGNYGIATALNPITVCTDNICNYTDTVGGTANSVTISRFGLGSYYPFLDFWPGSLTMAGNQDQGGASFANQVYCTKYRGQAPPTFTFVATPEAGGCINFTSPAPLGGQAQAMAFPTPAQQTPENNAFPGAAQLWPAKTGIAANDSGFVTGVKGIWNFGNWAGLALTYPFDIVTWADSNYDKTFNTVGNRPSWDSGDSSTGLDQAGGTYFRAGTSLTNYINVNPTGSNWAERLTSTLKTFNVPVTAKRLQVTSGTALVSGDFALSAGCGSSATKTVNRGEDGAFSFTLTEGGTGQSTSCTITLTFHDGTWTNIPVSSCNWDSASTDTTTAPPLVSDTATALVITYQGTPATNKALTVQCMTIGT